MLACRRCHPARALASAWQWLIAYRRRHRLHLQRRQQQRENVSLLKGSVLARRPYLLPGVLLWPSTWGGGIGACCCVQPLPRRQAGGSVSLYCFCGHKPQAMQRILACLLAQSTTYYPKVVLQVGWHIQPVLKGACACPPPSGPELPGICCGRWT